MKRLALLFVLLSATSALAQETDSDAGTVGEASETSDAEPPESRPEGAASNDGSEAPSSNEGAATDVLPADSEESEGETAAEPDASEAAEDGASEDGASEDGASEDGASEDGAAEDAAAEGAAAEDGTAEDEEDIDPADRPLTPEEAALHQSANPWFLTRERGFISGAIDVGFLYLRPRFSLGYGKPNFHWVGIDANPIIAISNVGAYLGLRYARPFFDVRVGGRYVVNRGRSYLPQCVAADENGEPCAGPDEYGTRAIYYRNESSASYLSLEAEVTLSLPLPNRDRIVSESSITYVDRVPEDQLLYEDRLRVILAPPWVWRQRIGYELRLGPRDAMRIGFIAEAIGVPKRELVVLRGGITLRINVSRTVQVRATWIPVLAGRDELGILGGDFGLLGMRYRFATGS